MSWDMPERWRGLVRDSLASITDDEEHVLAAAASHPLFVYWPARERELAERLASRSDLLLASPPCEAYGVSSPAP